MILVPIKSLGSCDCKQAYDGQDDLLFNLDNRHLFYYGYLLQYLHLMLEGKNPLIAFLRASTRSFLVQSHTKPVSIKLLRQAWNAFARLLCIDFVESFSCPICGPSPTTVICDGTLLGFRKDLMETFEAKDPSKQTQQPIQGSCHSDRVMLKTRKSRELLLKYSGYSRDRKCIRNPKHLTPSEFRQLLPADKKLSFFPSLPIVRGTPAYAADQVNSSRTPDDADSCRKYSSSHPSLTPGIFTVYCPHAICYGFEVMRSHESPQHPFEIFLTRFEQPPSTIIYDNSCKLHQYVLNRQPSHFQNTNFFVDRFHWRGHVGCSSGYSLDKYTTSDIATINSQVNEQANAGLQRIKG